MPTTSLGYPYPAGTDETDIDGAVQPLAAAVDASPGVASMTSAEIAALTGDAKRAGRTVYNATSGRLAVSNGSTFDDPVLLAAPVGEVKMFAGSSAPAGYLLCDGAAVSRATYAALFAVVGTAYGVGDGSITFNVPNLKGRVPVGRDAAQTEFDTLGEVGGAKTHTLSVGEMPSHSHGGATGVDSPDHTHTAIGAGSLYVTDTPSGAGVPTWSGSVTGGASARHTHSITSQGGGGAHNNLQPYQVLNYIIRVG